MQKAKKYSIIQKLRFLTFPKTFHLTPIPMASIQDHLIQIKHKETGEVYWTRKNKKKVERKIELKKYSKKLRKHVMFKEVKK